MIPAGTYRARPIMAALGMTKSGKEQIAIDFSLLDPEVAGQRVTFFSGFGSEKAADFTIKTLKTCGWKGDDLCSIEGLDQEVSLVIENEEYDGKQQTRVRYVNPLGGAAKMSIDAARARAFADRMKARVRAVGAEHGRDESPRPQRSERPEPPPYDDSQIPF